MLKTPHALLTEMFVCSWLLLQAFRYAKPLDLLTVLLEEFANPPGMKITHPGKDATKVGAVLKQVHAQPWLLDAGCGSGSFSAAARLLRADSTKRSGVLNILAYDHDEEVIKLAEKRVTLYDLKTLRNQAAGEGANEGADEGAAKGAAEGDETEDEDEASNPNPKRQKKNG